MLIFDMPFREYTFDPEFYPHFLLKSRSSIIALLPRHQWKFPLLTGHYLSPGGGGEWGVGGFWGGSVVTESPKGGGDH